MFKTFALSALAAVAIAQSTVTLNFEGDNQPLKSTDGTQIASTSQVYELTELQNDSASYTVMQESFSFTLVADAWTAATEELA